MVGLTVLWISGLLQFSALAYEPDVEPEDVAPVDGSVEAASELVPAQQGPTTYTLDPSTTVLQVVVRNDASTMMSKFGHDHVIVATNPRGLIQWDPSGNVPCNVAITVPITGLIADPPGSRENVGLDDRTISASQMQEMMSNMRGKRQLNNAVFPDINYQSVACSGTQGQVSVDGVMTIRGVQKPFSLPMTVSVSADEFRASGVVTLRHTDFGFNPYSAMMGALRNRDALEFRVNVHAIATP